MTEQSVINNKLKPGKVQAIEIMLLVNGILNLLTGLSITFGFVASIIGILCLPVVILPVILGGFEVYYASKLLSNKPVPSGNIKTIAIFEICSILYGNVIGLVVGILNLIFLEEEPVKEFLR